MSPMKSLRRREFHDDRGAAAVEFALILLPLMLIVGGIIDFGFGFNAQVGLTHAAREGVRVEAIGTGDGAAAAEAAFTDSAVTNVSATVTQPCPGDDAEVTITADYSPFFVGLLPISDPITLTGQAVMRCGG